MLDAQLDVPHRPNPSGALAKSRFPSTVPATQAVLSRYADYQIERMEILGDADCDMVFVALYHENRWVRRSPIVHIAVLCAAGHRLRLLRYGRICPAITAATNWVLRGESRCLQQVLAKARWTRP